MRAATHDVSLVDVPADVWNSPSPHVVYGAHCMSLVAEHGARRYMGVMCVVSAGSGGQDKRHSAHFTSAACHERHHWARQA